MSSNAHTNRLIKHALYAILVGMFCGFMLMYTLLGKISLSPLPISFTIPLLGTPDGWRVFHLGMLTNGMMAILFAGCIRWLRVEGLAAAWISWCGVATVWGNAGFYLFRMFATNRGLSVEDNIYGPANLSGGLSYMLGFVAVVTLLIAVILLLRAFPKN